jgi:hypothetical protein
VSAFGAGYFDDAADVPGDRYQGLIYRDWPLFLAEGEITHCIGDILAAVVADTERRSGAAVGDEVAELPPLGRIERAERAPQQRHRGGALETWAKLLPVNKKAETVKKAKISKSSSSNQPMAPFYPPPWCDHPHHSLLSSRRVAPALPRIPTAAAAAVIAVHQATTLRSRS